MALCQADYDANRKGEESWLLPLELKRCWSQDVAKGPPKLVGQEAGTMWQQVGPSRGSTESESSRQPRVEGHSPGLQHPKFKKYPPIIIPPGTIELSASLLHCSLSDLLPRGSGGGRTGGFLGH